MTEAKAGVRAPITAVLILLLAGAVPMLAQEGEQEEQLGDRETQETAAMSEAVYKELARAQEAADEGNHAEATKVIDRLMGRDLTSYERIQALNLLAFVYYSQDRTSQAIATYEKVLKEEAVNDTVRAGTMLNLSQLYTVEENWAKVVETLDKWFAMPNVKPQPKHLVLKGQAYYQLGNHRMVVSSMQQAINMAKASGQKIDEQWYLLLRVGYQELGMHSEVARILEDLVRHHPTEQYWLQLANAYGESGDSKRQLNVMELAYLQGFLNTETEIIVYYGLLLNNDLPYRAGKVLEKALEEGNVKSNVSNWRYLAQAWRLAQEDEKAIPALIQATKLSKDGGDDMILAQSYMNLDEWEKAAAAARKAINKGVDRPDEAWVMIGQALFNLEKFDEARQAFERAQADSRSRRLATQWLTYIENEVDRRQQLAAALED